MSASKDKAGAAAVAGSKTSAWTSPAAPGSTTKPCGFLMNNGDFLQRNPDLLDHLHVSHASGSAVSLVEKQVSGCASATSTSAIA